MNIPVWSQAQIVISCQRQRKRHDSFNEIIEEICQFRTIIEENISVLSVSKVVITQVGSVEMTNKKLWVNHEHYRQLWQKNIVRNLQIKRVESLYSIIFVEKNSNHITFPRLLISQSNCSAACYQCRARLF